MYANLRVVVEDDVAAGEYACCSYAFEGGEHVLTLDNNDGAGNHPDPGLVFRVPATASVAVTADY